MKDATHAADALEATGSYGARAFAGSLLRMARPYGLRLLLVAALVLVELTFALGLPLALEFVTDRAITEGDLRLLLLCVAALCGAFLLSTAAGVLEEYALARVGADALRNLRTEMFEHLVRQSEQFFDRTRPGDVLSRFSNDLNAIENALIKTLGAGIYYGLLLLGSVALLFVIEWQLAVVVLLAAPIAVLASNAVGKRVSSSSVARKREEANVVNVVQETVDGHAAMRLYGLGRILRERFAGRTKALARRSVRLSFLSALVGRSMLASVFIMVLAVIGLGGYLVIEGQLSLGSLVAFVMLLFNVDEAVNGLGDVVPDVTQGIGAMKLVDDFLHTAPRVPDAGTLRELAPLQDAVELAHVSFGYDPGSAILEDLNLRVGRHEAVALVGRSGSGKSTALKLIGRLYDPTRGSVRYDGVDLREVALDALYGRVAMVLQDSYLFEGTVDENIRLGRQEASDEAVIEAARRAAAHPFVATLPHGYGTSLGAGETSLSGGQRQRIAIARALLRQPDVLLLDEATSALDPATESAVNDGIDSLLGRCTIVSVTHRLAQAARMQRIVVMDGGRVAEDGSHEELMARGGLYRELWEKQGGFSISDDGERATVQASRLRAIPLLAELPHEVLDEMCGQFLTERYAEGAHILEHGDTGSRFYLIVQGSVRVLRPDASGDFQQVSVLEAGDYFGEIALLGNVPVTASVVASKPVICLSLRRELFDRLMERNPELRGTLAHTMQRRLQELAASASVDPLEGPEAEKTVRIEVRRAGARVAKGDSR